VITPATWYRDRRAWGSAALLLALSLCRAPQLDRWRRRRIAALTALPASRGGSTESRAIDILKARYAKGELTREQFEQLKRELGE